MTDHFQIENLAFIFADFPVVLLPQISLDLFQSNGFTAFFSYVRTNLGCFVTLSGKFNHSKDIVTFASAKKLRPFENDIHSRKNLP